VKLAIFGHFGPL